MKIKATSEIKKYLNKLNKNLYANYQNDYLDYYVDLKDEKKIKKELLHAGQIELKDNSISLFIDSKKWMNNPYIKNVNFNKIKNNKYRYENVLIEKGFLFNADEIQDDEEQELKDYMKLRTLNNDIEVPFLYQGNKEWMMCTPSETITNDPYALKAHDKVITFGLGIGYFVYKALLNKKVESITVIEKSKEVIELFNSIKKGFPNINKLKIINGDAFDYFNEKYLSKYDYIYVDIYKSSDDGRVIIEKLLEQYNPPYSKLNFWIEKSCLNVIRTLIYLHYEELVYQKENKTNKSFNSLMKKVRIYFSNINKEIDNPNTLKKYMYNPRVLREILSIKLN